MQRDRKRIAALLLLNAVVFLLVFWKGTTATESSAGSISQVGNAAERNAPELQVGQDVPRVALRRLSDGQTLWSDELSRGAPTVLFLGSYTCPMFRSKMHRFNQLFEEYSERGVNFYMVYIREAHPVDSGKIPQNRDLPPIYQAKTVEERFKVAETCVQALNVKMEALVDLPSNEASEKFDAWPERLIVLADDKILFAGENSSSSNDQELEQRLQAYLTKASD